MLKRIRRVYERFNALSERMTRIQEALGRIELRQVASATDAQSAEFRVFSQWGKDVVIPLDESRIERYFPRERNGYMASSTRMIREAIGNLEHWDEKSVLWSKGK